MKKIENLLIRTDNICDYIPVLSTAINLVDLFQKTVVLPRLSQETIAQSHYFTHLQNKEMHRCLALLIPFIGNVYISICDFRNLPRMKDHLRQLQQECQVARKESESLKQLYSIRQDWDLFWVRR